MSEDLPLILSSCHRYQKGIAYALQGENNVSEVFQSSQLESLRSRLKQKYEDLLLNNIEFAVKNDVDRQLWKYAFYAIIEKYRKGVKKQQEEDVHLELLFHDFLQEAQGFYISLVVSLGVKYDIPYYSTVDFTVTLPQDPRTISELQKLAIRTARRVILYVGDLARYGCKLGFLGAQQADVARREASRYYEMAHCLDPTEGSPQNQLGVLWTTAADPDNIRIMYYYCRSLAAKTPGPTAAANMKAFLAKYRKVETAPSAPSVSRTDLAALRQSRLIHCQQFKIGFVRVHDVIYNKLSLGSNEWRPTSFETECNVVLENFDRLLICTWVALVEGQDTKHDKGAIDCTQLLYIMLINMFAVHNSKTKGNDSTHLDCAVYLCLRQISQFFLWTAQFMSSLTHLDILESVLIVAKVILQWIVGENTLKLFAEKRGVQSVQKMWNAVAFFLNALYELDMATVPPAGNVRLREDFSLEGFGPLNHTADHKMNMDMDGDAAGRISTRIQQCLSMGQYLVSHSNASLLISIDGSTFLTWSSDGRQIAPVLDEVARLPNNTREAFRNRELVMKAMAQQRLQAEVQDLEIAAANVPSVIMPAYLILDSSCFTTALNSVKEIIKSKKFVVILPLATISALDALKKGNDKVNKSAREATRFLENEFKEGLPTLKSQSRDESMDVPDEVAAQDLEIDAKRILSCCVYFSKNNASKRKDLVWLLSADKALLAAASSQGISATQILSFVRMWKPRAKKQGN
eukprot:m.34248 g.34248  ORF g.34248 m.34248 type:complete len:746 (+) comp8694_c0_seq1:200-2437(+)